MKKAIFVKYPHVGFVLKCKLSYLLTIFTSQIKNYIYMVDDTTFLFVRIMQFKCTIHSCIPNLPSKVPLQPLLLLSFSPTRKPMLPSSSSSSSHPASTPHHHHPSRQGQTRCCHRRASHCRSPVAVDVVAIVDLRHSPYCSSFRHQMEKKR